MSLLFTLSFCIIYILNPLLVRTNESDAVPNMNHYRGSKDSNDIGARIAVNSERLENIQLAKFPKYPILASVRSADMFNREKYTHRCSGILITTDTIMSVAHCLHDQYGNFLLEPSTYRSLIGTNIRADAIPNLRIKELWMHPNYRRKNRIHDISLFKLKKSIPVFVPDLYFLRPENAPNETNCAYFTWTVFLVPEKAPNDIELALAGFKVNKGNNSHCNNDLQFTQQYSSPFHICIEVPRNRGSCIYNAGSPVLCQEIVIGLYSYSLDAQQTESSGRLAMFTDIGNYMEEIEAFVSDAHCTSLNFCRSIEFYFLIKLFSLILFED